ncbi:MAG TPA: LpqB family beta-propeller domain-containing protein, partial [Vicinamibacterales bacterium]
WIYFSSTSHDIAGNNDVFRVSADGGTPMEVAADRYTNEYFATESPDGSAIAMTARATASGQWWRNGRSHLDEAEVWVVRAGATPSYQAITNGGAKEMWPLWAADGKSLYYVSDRGGAQNVWSKPIAGDGPPRQLTRFSKGRVLWPSISNDGRLISFEHDFEIWTLDTSSNSASRVSITRRGAPAATGVEHLTLTDGFSNLVLSPDGKKVAFVARGEVFAASAKDGGDAARLTRTTENEQHLAWSPDSRRLIYSSDRNDIPHIYQYDFASNEEAQLTSGTDAEHSAMFSPDGKRLAMSAATLSCDRSKSRRRLTGCWLAAPLTVRRLRPFRRWRGRPTGNGSHFSRPATRDSRTSTSSTPRARRRDRRVSWRTHLPTPSHGRRTVRPCTSTPANARSCGRSRASTWCRAHRASARISSAICSKRPGRRYPRRRRNPHPLPIHQPRPALPLRWCSTTSGSACHFSRRALTMARSASARTARRCC